MWTQTNLSCHIATYTQLVGSDDVQLNESSDNLGTSGDCYVFDICKSHLNFFSDCVNFRSVGRYLNQKSSDLLSHQALCEYLLDLDEGTSGSTSSLHGVHVLR